MGWYDILWTGDLADDIAYGNIHLLFHFCDRYDIQFQRKMHQNIHDLIIKRIFKPFLQNLCFQQSSFTPFKSRYQFYINNLSEQMREKKAFHRKIKRRYHPIKQVEPESQLLKRPSKAKEEPAKAIGLQTQIVIGAVILTMIGLAVFIGAIWHIDKGHDVKKDNEAVKNEHPNLKAQKDNRNSIQKKKKMKSEIKITQLNNWIQTWVERIKKLSTEISMVKLQRALKMFKALSSQISPQIYNQEKQSFIRDYEINKFAEKPICIVIPTYNNMKDERYKKNIDSILMQEYTNYRAIVIDDASSDGTSEAILSYIANHAAFRNGRVRVQQNKVRKMALTNILDAGQNFCHEDDIFMVIDGDDYLLGKQVFKLFNAAFSSSDAWVVYSNFLTIQGKVGYSRRYPPEIIQNRQFRKVLFIISHLRAFYTKLLHKIKPQDLKDRAGQQFHAANDVAIFMPILEMSSDHILYLREINYYYNSDTGMNNHDEKKKEQIQNDRYIRSMPKYDKIEKLFTGVEAGERRVAPFYDEDIKQ